jgi:hypothetical protein
VPIKVLVGEYTLALEASLYLREHAPSATKAESI